MQPLHRVREGNAVNAVRLPVSGASKETPSRGAAASIDPCRGAGGAGEHPADGDGASHSALSECVTRTIRRYLADIGDTLCDEGLHALVIREVEGPLLREVLAFHDGNQSRAAIALGINRATLRKKLATHGLL
jgi:Fis family transcriptional regulator, factor for inversion stimulation protein